MLFISPNGNRIEYLFDYGTVTKTNYILFDDEINLVNQIQDFKNSRNVLGIKMLTSQFIKTLRKIKEQYPNAFFVAVPSSSKENNQRLIDHIVTKFNDNNHQVLERTVDIESAHKGGHSDEHYHVFKDTLKNNHIDKQHFILIDDICTSGRTIDICKENLEFTGKKVVAIVVLAKTISLTNLDIGDYPLEIIDRVHNNEYMISMRFNNGRYLRINSERDFGYVFNHSYAKYVNSSELPECKEILVSVTKWNDESDFKKIKITFKYV